MNKELSYEKAFERLEEILNLLNENKASLEDSLKLFEEANSLINQCNQKLNSAEKKIEALIKTRDGSLMLNEKNEPTSQEFLSNNEL